jgi:hypothetical protein
MTASDLLQMPYPAEFMAGAQSAVTTCLRIDPTEKVTLITDRATEQIAASIGEQLAARGCEWNAFLARRPGASAADQHAGRGAGRYGELAGFYLCGASAAE